MDLTIYLSQVIGLYLVIAGVIIMARQRFFMPVIGAFVEDRLTRVLLAFIELIAGLFFVVGYQDWTTLSSGILTVFGWLMLVEGTLYLILPDDTLDEILRRFNTRAWYIGGGIASIVIGLYLAGTGFGWL